MKKYTSKTWTNQARLWNWKERAEAWDIEIMLANKAKRENEIQDSLYSGLALADQRVKYLKEIANKLMSDFRDEGKIWVVEERIIGQGEKSSLTVIKKFNDKLVRELRETMGDIALEQCSGSSSSSGIYLAGRSWISRLIRYSIVKHAQI